MTRRCLSTEWKQTVHTQVEDCQDMDSLKDNEVYISVYSFADKYGIKPGDTIKLDAPVREKNIQIQGEGNLR